MKMKELLENTLSLQTGAQAGLQLHCFRTAPKLRDQLDADGKNPKDRQYTHQRSVLCFYKIPETALSLARSSAWAMRRIFGKA